MNDNATENAKKMDAFICVHRRDVGYLLEMVLRSYTVNFQPQRHLMLISNDLPYLRDFIERLGLSQQVSLSSDEDWLSKDELTLGGWYKQQLIKLRAYQFCETENFCNLGADTLLLQPLSYSDLVKDGLPVMYYTRHMPPNLHYLYEWLRVGNIARILQVKPGKSRRYVDFINDLFCFNRSELMGLNRHLEKLYGPNYFYNLLCDFGSDPRNQKKFGEWTLYNMYILECVKRPVEIRNSAAGFLTQLHNLSALEQFRFDSKVAHFVGKDFDVDYIKNQVIRQQGELGRYLVQAQA